jgi:hypothetical protein
MFVAIILFLSSQLLLIAGLEQRPSIPPDTFISLQRSADMFGNGVDYKVTVDSKGIVIFKRFKNIHARETKNPEPIQTRIAPETLLQLIREFDHIQYFSLRDRYMTIEDGCPGEITDQPSAQTSLTIDHKTKTIYHDYGCQQHPGSPIYPEFLTKLEQRIDELLETKQLLK